MNKINRFLYVLQNIDIIKYSKNKEYILKYTNKDYIIKNGYIYYIIDEAEKLSIIKNLIIENWFLYDLDSKEKTKLAMEYVKDLEELWVFFNPMFLLYDEEIKEKKKVEKLKQIKKEEMMKKFIQNKNKNNKNFKSISIDYINDLSITDVLDKLGIEYKIKGNTIILYDNGKYTDGRRGNIKDNYITDFSKKNRGSGGPFNFVKTYLKLDNNETFNWFKEVFSI